jgi:Carboxypeptidase regulatory-like domain/TonB-dependent Receptor Plug Domain
MEENHVVRAVRSAIAVCAATLCTVLVTSTLVFAQASTTATIRGTIQDTSGAVLPGATVTLTNEGTSAVQTAVSDDRGQYLFAGLFPGTYDLKVELSGFKTYERKGIALSPNDTRGLDIRLDIGQQTETVTVTGQQEVIQTETGAREGVLTAKQIDNLSVVGRSALELLRILPGVVTEFNQGESVSFGGGGNATQNYTVNGIRASSNTVALDGSSLIDIGSNNGVIVSLNNDMVQEVKVQSSNFAAEYGSGGMNVSGVTKSGTSAFHGEAYDYWRDYRLAANDRDGEAQEHVSVSGRKHWRSDHVRRQLHEEPRQAVLLRCVRGTAAAGRFGVALHAHLHAGDAQRRLQRAAREPRLQFEQRPAVADSSRLPRRGRSCAEQRHAAVPDAAGIVLREPLSTPKLQRLE